MLFQPPNFDTALQSLINTQWRNTILDTVMPILSDMHVLFILVILLAIYATYKKGPKQLILFAVIIAATGLTDLSTNPVKHGIGRVRPLNALAGTHYREDGQWRQRPTNFVSKKDSGTSYPSAHAANTMCIAVLTCLLWPSLRPWPLLLPLAVGYSRVYLGKHYPLDVLMGWLFGMVTALAVWIVWSRLVRPRIWPQKDQSPNNEAAR